MVATTTLHTPLATSRSGAAGQTRPSILLISGWNLYNIGDVAITPGFLRLVRRYVPEAKVTILAASYPEELRAYLHSFPEQLGDFDLLPLEF